MYGGTIRFDQEPEAEASTNNKSREDRKRHKSVSAIKSKFDDSNLLISEQFKA